MGIQDEKQRAGTDFSKAAEGRAYPVFKAIQKKQRANCPTAPRSKCIKSWETPQNLGYSLHLDAELAQCLDRLVQTIYQIE